MKGHLGAVMVSALGAIALALVLLQAAVVAFHGTRHVADFPAIHVQSNRFSVPANRSAIPWGPFEKAQPPPGNREGRTPERRQQEEHHRPPPSPGRGFPQMPGPRAPRKLAA